ncbi:MAG: YfhO family protein [Acidobacteria bacterium]|nr:YfhO family protein [Acidobacteriota bacterium]
MAKAQVHKQAPGPFEPLPGWKLAGATAFVLLLFYFTPLLSPGATIQWDAVDISYPAQQFFAAQAKLSHLPFWTPTLFGGFPFLADPQVGAFYPLNWPFFLAGITPGMIEAELALHSVLALLGAYLLLKRLSGQVHGALVGALIYSLGGFFAAHSSHVGMFQGAALFPWLLYAVERALEGAAVRWMTAGAAVMGGIVLTGHIQTAFHAFFGLVLFAIWRLASEASRWKVLVPGMIWIAVLALGLSAIVTHPAIELAGQSIRAGMDFSDDRTGTLTFGALTTLVYANSLGVLDGRYTGGGDMTHTYLYSGLLLLPLAGLALKYKPMRLLGLLLVLLPAWYMLGPSAGLYRAGALIPGMQRAPSPVHLWFVAAMGLSILAAFGTHEAEVKWRKPWLGLALCAVFAVDLCFFNSWNNPLTYGHASYEEIYGVGEKALKYKVAPGVQAPFRLHIPPRTPVFGPLNSQLTAQVETTGGYNPLELLAWSEYLQAAEKNHRLVDGLGVILEVDPRKGEANSNPTLLPRAYFSPEVVGVKSMAESRAKLPGLDPGKQSLVLNLPAGVDHDAQGKALEMKVTEGRVEVRYSAASPSLLRLADPWYPGWKASVDGKPVALLRVNHALMGAVVPAGYHEAVFEYEPQHFQRGMQITLGSLLVLLLTLAASRPHRR